MCDFSAENQGSFLLWVCMGHLAHSAVLWQNVLEQQHLGPGGKCTTLGSDSFPLAVRLKVGTVMTNTLAPDPKWNYLFLEPPPWDRRAN